MCLDQPLSMWGGLDPESGTIIDSHHPQRGVNVAGTVLVMTSGRGSSSSSSVLAEAIRGDMAPAAIVLREADEIIVLGALVAGLLDGKRMPVLQLDETSYAQLRNGDRVTIDEQGHITIAAA